MSLCKGVVAVETPRGLRESEFEEALRRFAKTKK